LGVFSKLNLKKTQAPRKLKAILLPKLKESRYNWSKTDQNSPKTQQNFETRPIFRENSTKLAPKLNVPEVLPTFAPLKNAQKKAWGNVMV